MGRKLLDFSSLIRTCLARGLDQLRRDAATMTAARLDSLTNELFEDMVEYLDLADLRNLRMASKVLSFKVTQNHFASYFLHKKIDLTQLGLQAFVQATSQGARLGCRVRHLTLTGVEYSISELEEVFDTGEVITDTALGMRLPPKRRACGREELSGLQASLDKLRRCQADDDDFHKQGMDVSLLSEALRNISTYGGHGIEILRLEIIARIDGIADRRPAGAVELQNRRFGLSSAARTFAVVASSLQDNALAIQRFELFSGSPSSTWCSLPYDTFSLFDWEPSRSWPSLGAVKKLSMRLSDRFTNVTGLNSTNFNGCCDMIGRDPELAATLIAAQLPIIEREREIDSRHCKTITRMQQLCRHLEELEITWYRLSHLMPRSRYDRYMYDPNGETAAVAQWNSRQSYMRHLSQANPFPLLRNLQLEGLSLLSDDLLAFVKNHAASLREISLENVQAVDSLFTPLFEFLASRECNIEWIHLRDLQEGYHSLMFLPEQESEFTHVSGVMRQPSVIDRWGADAKLVIRCFPRTKRWRTPPLKVFRRADRLKVIAFGSTHAGLPCWNDLPVG